MIATQLQDDLISELQNVLRNELFKNENHDPDEPASKECIPLNFYSQSLPIESSRDDDEKSYFPYVIVKLDSGNIPDTSSAHEVKTIIVIGLYDNNLNNQGYRDILHIINMIYERFAENPCLCKKYIAKEPFNWALQDEETHPYFFGGIELSFDIPAVKREDEFA